MAKMLTQALPTQLSYLCRYHGLGHLQDLDQNPTHGMYP